MKVKDLKQLIERIHELFPLPVDPKFKGTHNIILNENGDLTLCIWFQNADNEIKYIPVFFDDEEIVDPDEIMELFLEVTKHA